VRDVGIAREELVLANIADTRNYMRAVHREGRIILDTASLPIESVLFDTGALSASYISKQYVDTHREDLAPFIRQARGAVRLAAQNVVVPISEVLHLTVVFTDDSGQEHRAVEDYFVLPGSSNSMVVGLPSILSRYGKFFLRMLESVMDEYDGEPSHALSSVEGDLHYPWSAPLDLEAPEDLDTPLPCSFSDALHFMEMSYEDAKKEYFGQIDQHVSPAFRAATKVEELLRSDRGVAAFIPSNWEGIRMPPLELKWKEGLPERMHPKARPVNPRLLSDVKKEIDRLRTYIYEPSDSPIASCLVVAPKATAPFIRLCGDYVAVNKFIETGHYPIPHVQRALEKICRYKIFLDIDLVNAFHQVPLHWLTSQRLSIQTPWGQFAPRFMPEGIAPATFVLQETVSKIFSEFDDWSIAIFDNLLVLADTYEDAYKKLEKIIDKCIEFNLYLKFSKTWLGFERVHFFGYDCTYQSYGLSEQRKKTLNEYSPPRTVKQMQSFLGAALFFKSFVPHYSSLAAPLSEMTKADTRWDAQTWTPDRLKAFDVFKAALQSSFSLFYPDYSLVWVLRTDASMEGVGMALFQVYHPSPEAEPQYQCIMFASQKFSKQARNWTTIEQEAYGIYFAILNASYYLRCKAFILETDHANLMWMEASQVPKVIRWRIYCQSFNFVIRHIKGKQNLVADWLSRSHSEEEIAEALHSDPPLIASLLAAAASEFEVKENFGDTQKPVTPDDALAMVHGKRMGHNGARRTWMLLNEHFAGHRIPYSTVEDFVSKCAVCQKDRLGMTNTLQPLYRTLKTADKRKMVGVDTLTVTPPDKWGNQYVIVVVVHATKLVALYPTAGKGAIDTATALFKFFSTYGVYENLISDPGSDLMSEVVAQLTAWFGIRHVFSLVDRHESNGVEGTNKSVLRHLKAFVMDERIADRWSSPDVINLIQYWLNAQVSNETGLSPFHAHFGTDDSTYLKLPELLSESQTATEFVRLLDDNLRTLWDISCKHQLKLLRKRVGDQDDARQNQFQPGDLVLFRRNTSAPLPSKLTMRFAGPFEVLSQSKNDVECRHLCVKTVHKFHVERLKLYVGTRADAERVAQVDHDQYEVAEILCYRGNPMIRQTMEFRIRFADGDERWVTWSKDLFDTTHYEHYCKSVPALFPLIYQRAEAERRIAEINALPITEVEPQQRFFLDLRQRGGATWYNAIGLPDSAMLTYMLPCVYTRWVGKQHRKIKVECALTNEVFDFDHYTVRAYGSCMVIDPARMVLIDASLVKKYPKIASN